MILSIKDCLHLFDGRNEDSLIQGHICPGIIQKKPETQSPLQVLWLYSLLTCESYEHAYYFSLILIFSTDAFKHNPLLKAQG